MGDHPAPWRWTEEPASSESEQGTVRLVDAKGEDVVWAYQVGLYDDDLPCAINAEESVRALLWSATMGIKAADDWPMRCYHCRRWFDRDFFWNPWGPNKGPGLCCSEECCAAVKSEPTPIPHGKTGEGG